MIARVQFSEVGKVGKSVGTPNLPERHGGLARPETAAWVAQRLAAFPRMGLPEAF